MNGNTKKEFEFNADDLIGALGDVRDHVSGRGKITMRTHTVTIPEREKSFAPNEIKSIRKRLNVSQNVFARLLNVPRDTEISWETGRRNPSGAAVRLLQIAEKEPALLLNFGAATKSKKKMQA